MAEEADLQKAILEFLGGLPDVFAWRNNRGRKGHVRFGGPPGAADIMGIIAPTGRFLAIEVKGPRGSVTSEQANFLNEIADKGGFAMVARTFDEVVYAMAAAGVRFGLK